jgi:virginiamycin A acetyltransferase
MRHLLKTILNSGATLCVLPAALCYWASATLLGSQRSFPGWSQGMSLLPGSGGVYLRRAFYGWVLPQCEAGSVISFGTVFSHPTAQMGANAYAGVYCCLGDVTIENDVLIGSHVSIMNGSRQHGIQRLDIPVREQPGEWPRITIGEDSWIGDRAVVMADVGKHCVVGAGSVVTKPVPDYAIVLGVPARITGYRGQDTEASVADNSARLSASARANAGVNAN